MVISKVTTAAGESTIFKIRQNMTAAEHREFLQLDDKTSRMWRNFWIKAMKNRGASNVQIAKEFGLSEGTVRAILKK